MATKLMFFLMFFLIYGLKSVIRFGCLVKIM